MAYEGVSLVDFLKSSGQPSDYTSRAALATQKGISGYSGSASQNLQLLQMLRSTAPAAQPTAQPTTQPTAQPTPTAQPATQPTAQPTPQAGNDEQALITAMTQKGHTVETAKAAIAGRGYANLAREYLGATGGATGASPLSGFTQPTIDLPAMYQNLFKTSGISEKEQELITSEKRYLEARGKISDNPFLAASIVDKRLQRLAQKYDEETAPLRSEIATKKADIETQINLQTKQFDINSQQAQQALQQFNALLSAGALSGASGEDIANITRATGISSSMIQAAVNAQKKKDVKTQVVTSTNDAGVVTAVVLNTETGDIISKQNLGAIGNVQKATKATEVEKKETYMNYLRKDAASGVNLKQIFSIYSGFLDPNEILNLYNTNSMYGPATESAAELTKYGVKPLY